ncbi:hypothetical protein FPZ24_15050 [Sphingomonas panacisoli]|uniref:Uncharacterized protein n=1 Tax=Sphingomonas panacisoli TaxID=1813879 RepID=A0A5B8LKF2_9SPHN|nr:hypothetical protein [Sphingomonas panacisoli]QDZ08621.1 hypothetical protein FPZ24_15050 [Sphingomonas panacisoli]
MRPLPFALAAFAIAAPAAARDVPVATPVGEPVSCIQLNQLRETHVRSDQVIDFELTGKRIYRNTLDGACPSLGFEERFAYSVSNGQLCSTDLITVLQSTGGRGATCGLGKFQPVSIAK